MSHFGREYASNYFLPREIAENEINSGKMYYLKADSSLFILRDKSTHFAVYYCLKIGGELDLSSLPEPAVTETAFRERDEKLRTADDKLISAGFRREFYRNRMTRLPENGDIPQPSENVRSSTADDFDTARELLCGCFSPITGCLPDEDELHCAVSDGRILLHRGGGLLHYNKTKSGFELRHLCVAEKARGCGVGGELVRAYNSMLDKSGRKSVVWVREGYAPAERIYENNGCKKDGMRSSVLIYSSGNKLKG